MKTDKKQYKEMVKKASPKSSTALNCMRAFFVGGVICAFGEVLHNIYEALGASKDHVGAYVAITLIFLAIMLTGIGKYDNITKYAGAGASIPITGFANAMSSPAIEHKKEGFILGVSAKLFTIAGAVIVYGTLSSMVVGLVYFLVQKFSGG